MKEDGLPESTLIESDIAKAGPRANRVPKQMRGELQAGRILTVALDLFARHHVASVTTKQIAAESNVNSALLYYYFQNKDDLFRQAVDYAVGEVLGRFETLQDTASSPSEILSGWLQLHIQQFELIRKFVKVAVDYASSDSRTQEIDASIGRFYETERRILCKVLQEGIDSGSFDEVDVEQTASYISVVLDGIVTRSLILRDFDFLQTIEDLRGSLSQRLGVAIK
jgi:AcrR family transcriptional regulator